MKFLPALMTPALVLAAQGADVKTVIEGKGKAEVRLVSISSSSATFSIKNGDTELELARIKILSGHYVVGVCSISKTITPKSDITIECKFDFINEEKPIPSSIDGLEIKSFSVLWGRGPKEFDEIKQAEADLEKAIRAQPKAIQKLIRQGKIKMGMNTAQVVLSWGAPISKNSTVNRRGRHEQWVYPNDVYVYFDNGKVTGWQSSD